MLDVVLSEMQGKCVKSIAEWYKQTRPGNEDQFYLGGFAGSGKEQPLTCELQSPNGPIKMGDVKVGDKIYGAKGNITTVTGVFPQGVKPAYEVEFRDKTTTQCGLGHLWYVQTTRQKIRGTHRVIPLSEIIDLGVLRPSGDMRFQTPLAIAVPYKESKLPVHPYLLGLLLGDGHLHGNSILLSIANTQLELIEKVKNILPLDVSFGKIRQCPGCVQATIKQPMKNILKVIGLNVHGKSKFIPEEYLRSSISQRSDLLQGLMDSDGSITKNRINFSNKNKILVDDVCTLVRSLGGTAIIRISDRKDKGIEYAVNVKTLFNPFKLKEKADKWSPSWKNPPSKYIRKVTYIGDVEQQCISVDAPDSLYLTDDFITTHNTTILPDVIDACGLDIKDVAFAAPTGKASKVMTKKLRSQFPNMEPAKTIHSLIMKPGQAKAEKLERILEALRTSFTKQSHDPNFTATKECAKMRTEIEMVQKELDSAYRETDKPNFHLNVESTVREKSLIVVDEASMVGNIMACDLARFGVPILAIGDPFQLPPVGDVAGLTAGEPDFFLTEIHRQALDNPIIYLTKQIREGIDPNYGTFGGVVHVVRPRDDVWTTDRDYDAQVLCGTHKKKWILTQKIRKACGFDSTGPMADERLLVCKNSRNIPELVNGSFVWNLKDFGDLEKGQVTMALNIEDEDTGLEHRIRAVQGLFEEHQMRQRNAHSGSSQAVFHAKIKEEHLDYGHAITVHKSQGSEWENVVVHDESGVFREDSKRWLYTATSRAKDELILVRI